MRYGPGWVKKLMDSIKYHTTVGYWFLTLGVKKQLEYPLFYTSWIVSLAVICINTILMFYVLVTRFSPLYGWSFPQLVLMYGLSYISQGFQLAFMSQCWRIDYYIIRGDYDRMLLRPLGVVFQFLFRNIYLPGILDALGGMGMFLYGCHLVGFEWSLLNVIKVLIIIAGATLIRGSFLMILGCTAFWIKRSISLVQFGSELLSRATMYPLSIYPYVIQVLFTFLLPFGFISFYPSGEFLGFGNRFTIPLSMAVWTLLAGVLLAVLANIVVKLGFKIYESAGS